MTRLLITPEDVQRAARRLEAQRGQTVTLCNDTTDRQPSHPRLKALAATQGGYPLPEGKPGGVQLPIIMEDDIIHTIDYPVCGDPECICAELEYEQSCAETQAGKPAAKRARLGKHNRKAAPAPRGELRQGFHLLR